MPDEEIQTKAEFTEAEIDDLALAIGEPTNGTSANRRWYQYPVKVVCGDGSLRGPVALGHYFTAINIHNPDPCHAVKFRWKVTVALPGKPGPVSRFMDATLGPDESMEIDCPDIRRLSGYDAELLKGFVVVQTPSKLDIVAVYTATQGQDQPLQTMDIEKVDYTYRFRPCRPLDRSLDTRQGSGWQVAKLNNPGQHGLQPVVDVASPSWGVTLPSGVRWVADSANAKAPGTYVYVYRFRLSCCYKNPILRINRLYADNNIVWVRLNGVPVSLTGDLVDNFATGNTPANGQRTTNFRCGWNEVRILVRNRASGSGSPTNTGIALDAQVYADDGIC